MRTLELLVRSDGTRLRAAVPETRRERMRGLRGRAELAAGDALLLERTSSVHTVGMGFPLLVAFLDDDLRVLGIRRVPAGRLLLPRRGVRHVLECRIDEDVRVGDRLVPLGAPRGDPLAGPAARQAGGRHGW